MLSIYLSQGFIDVSKWLFLKPRNFVLFILFSWHSVSPLCLKIHTVLAANQERDMSLDARTSDKHKILPKKGGDTTLCLLLVLGLTGVN